MRFVVLCSLLAAAPAFGDDLVARRGDDSIRLSADQPCKSESVLGRLAPQVHGSFRAASAVVSGKTYAACWRATGDRVYLMYEDGDEGLVPVRQLRPELSV